MDRTDLRAMQALAAECWRLAPETVNAAANVGVLAWDHGAPVDASETSKEYRLWRDGRDVLAWSVIFPPHLQTVREGIQELSKTILLWQVHPDRPALLDSILDWFVTETPGMARLTNTRAVNADARRRIEAHSFTYAADEAFDLMNMRDLREIAEPLAPAGYAFKTMAEVKSIERRVAIHRAAWQSERLTEGKYHTVMSTWPYRPELDFVVEAPDGSLACSALGWYDEVNRVGEFEPVGTHPDHRRLGLASNLMLFGMQRFREVGATHAIVGCRGDDAYPIPKRVYHGIGFREISRDVPYVLQ